MKIPPLTPQRKLVLAGLLAFVTLISALVVGISLHVLRTQSASPFTHAFTRIVPVPVARANGRFVYYDDVLARWDAVDASLASAPPPSPTDNYVIPSRETLRRQAYEQAIREAYLAVQADEEGFELPAAAVKRNLDQLVARNSSTVQEVDQYLRESLGWSLEEFGERVVRPATLEEALAQRAVAANASTTEDLWREQLLQTLQSDKVIRYLKFTAPLE